MDLSFGFDDPNFSDRTLLLEIIGDAAVDNDDRSHRLRNVKRLRYDTNATLDTTLSPPSRVKTIHINSLILAGRSLFFRKLFSNGMRESEQKHVTLRIDALEEVSFMDLLKYVYSNNLPTTFDALLDLSWTADKFEVDSCSRDCTRALQKIPMTCESASVYLDLPPCLLMSPAVQPLVNAAKQFLIAKFKDLDEFKEEVLELPLLGLDAILSSDDFQVTSEFEVYECVLEWVCKHYPDSVERQEILKTHLLHLVRFPFMTTTQLTEDVLTCNDIDRELASQIVIRALSFKAETDSSRKRCLSAEKGIIASRQFVERAYIYRPVKVVELESHQQCVVYFDLTRNELNRIFPNGTIWSKTFHLVGQQLDLSVTCSTSKISKFQVALVVSVSSTYSVKYEFAVRGKPQEEFRSWFRGIHKFNMAHNWKILRDEEWSSFIREDNSHFINGVLHLKAELTIVNDNTV